MKRYDVAIIGAGTAGLAALRQVRHQTENFILINDGAYGTTCARVGCMPSKALIEAANLYELRTRFARMGITGSEQLRVDRAAVLRHVRSLRDSFVAGVLTLTAELGERNLAGRARFVEPQVLTVNGERLHAERIVIATGAHPVMPPEWRSLGTRVLTTDTLFEQTTLPNRIAVAGLGGIGAEMGQALCRLGIEVTGFDALEQIAGLSDAAVNAQAVAALGKEFPLHLGAPVALRAEDDQVRASANGHEVSVDLVLAALGRRPNVDGLGLEHLGVELDQHGVPPFDPQTMQIADLPVFIAGDANADVPVLHEASDEGYIAGCNAARGRSCFQRRTPLVVVFTDPNIAVVGRSFGQLQKESIVIGEANLQGQGRLRMRGDDRGVLRVYAANPAGHILGAELCAPHGEHLAHLLALAVQQRLTVPDLLRMPFYHPSVEEGLRTALRDAVGKLPSPEAADLAACEPLAASALD